ncbi:MAG: AAA family ATPase [Deltaproteobacteria bacterium]|nr:AAA family ATPase [Deltaproteobacteria bacterium]
MITAIKVQDLRGVRSGALSALAPLSVLVGRNGAGKSAVLEALAIGASDQPAELLGRVVQSRGGWCGAGYLVRMGAEAAQLRVTLSSGVQRTTRLTYAPHAAALEPAEVPPGTPGNARLSSVSLLTEVVTAGQADPAAPAAPWRGVGRVLFADDNAYGASAQPPTPGERLRLVHPAATRGHPLWRTLGEAVRTGRDQAAVELLRPVVGADLRDLYFMPEGDDARVGNVHLRYPWGSVPVDVAGDGVRALVRIALELAARPDEVVLIEEPEVHLHPGAIWAAARAALEAQRRGVQVILSTHSLELIDALVDQAGDALDAVAVTRLALQAGELRAHTIPGPELRLLRGALAEELR